MATRGLLLTLVYIFVLLIVVLAVLAGLLMLVEQFKDANGALAVRWAIGCCLVAAGVDLVLLVGTLAVREIDRGNGDRPSGPS